MDSRAERLTLPAGRVILHQGEVADRFYVLARVASERLAALGG